MNQVLMLSLKSLLLNIHQHTAGTPAPPPPAPLRLSSSRETPTPTTFLITLTYQPVPSHSLQTGGLAYSFPPNSHHIFGHRASS